MQMFIWLLVWVKLLVVRVVFCLWCIRMCFSDEFISVLQNGMMVLLGQLNSVWMFLVFSVWVSQCVLLGGVLWCVEEFMGEFCKVGGGGLCGYVVCFCNQIILVCSFLFIFLIGCFRLVCLNLLQFGRFVLYLVIQFLVKVLFWMFFSIFFMCVLVLVLIMCGLLMQLLYCVVLEMNFSMCEMLFLQNRLMISFSLCSILQQVIFGWQLVLIRVLKLVCISVDVLLYSIVCLLNRLVLVFFLKVVWIRLVWVLLRLVVQVRVYLVVLLFLFWQIVQMYGMSWLILYL